MKIIVHKAPTRKHKRKDKITQNLKQNEKNNKKQNKEQDAKQKTRLMKALKDYDPHTAYIGYKKSSVPNFLFGPSKQIQKEGASPYSHCEGVVRLLKQRTVKEEYEKANRLTHAMFRKGLTFSKYHSCKYEEFCVACSPIVVPIPEPMFRRIERGSQKLVSALRLILQSIYGNAHPEESDFLKSLSIKHRQQFLANIKSSPHYIPQLHHPNMKQYPFFDVVGLDLALTKHLDDVLQAQHMTHSTPTTSSELPFHLIELNAGSPSGASNNQQMLEIMEHLDPEMLNNAGTIIPNDHFKTLASVYNALGQYWTRRSDGITIILAPGSESGATPEIHELARRSGILYCDASELFMGDDGYLRIRNFTGQDHIVTAIYSRINSNSALFSESDGIFLRDFDSGKTIFTQDPLSKKKKIRSNDKKQNRSNSNELKAKLPVLQSMHAIPNLLSSVLNRKVYLGGLNRLLDDKCLLETICTHGPAFFADEPATKSSETKKMSHESFSDKLIPPPSPKSAKQCLHELRWNAENWVIKSPHLSGGSGIHILRCLNSKTRKKIVDKYATHPKQYAIQKLVTLGHIPSPTKSHHKVHYANLASDLRMWVFFGAGPNHCRPILTHNALMRTAPTEKGPYSSIVNTSLGGGYAPTVFVDTETQLNSQQLTNEKNATTHASNLISNEKQTDNIIPIMASSKIFQCMRICDTLAHSLITNRDSNNISFLIDSLRSQIREVASYLPESSTETAQDLFQWKQKFIRTPKQYKTQSHISITMTQNQVKLANWISTHQQLMTTKFLSIFDALNIWKTNPYGNREKKQDINLALEIKSLNKQLAPLANTIIQQAHIAARTTKVSHIAAQQGLALLSHIQHNISGLTNTISFSTKEATHLCSIQQVLPESASASQNIATIWEFNSGLSLVESNRVPDHFKEARYTWQKKCNNMLDINSPKNRKHLEIMRAQHFSKFPFLRQLQETICKGSVARIDELLNALQAAPYAQFNLLEYARRHKKQALDVLSGILQQEAFTQTALFSRAAEEIYFEGRHCLGEALLHKGTNRSSLSGAKIAIWVSRKQSPLSAAYTLGHELVHAFQFEELQHLESQISSNSPLGNIVFATLFAGIFENDFSGADFENTNRTLGRQHIFGFKNLLGMKLKKQKATFLQRLLSAAKKGPEAWNHVLKEIGNSVAYATSPRNCDRVRASREVLPALENAKNIRFAKSLGLKCRNDEYSSAMPFCSQQYRNIHRSVVDELIESTSPSWEQLRILANAQLPGVFFPKNPNPKDWAMIRASYGAISLGGISTQSQ